MCDVTADAMGITGIKAQGRPNSGYAHNQGHYAT